MTTMTYADTLVDAVKAAFQRFGKAFTKYIEVASYTRASAELARQGFHKEAKALAMELKALKERS